MTATVEVRPDQSPQLELLVERLDFLVKQIKEAVPNIEEVSNKSAELRDLTRRRILEAAMSFRGAKNIKPELIDAFLVEPYSFGIDPVKGRRDAYYLHVPRFYDRPFGTLVRQTRGYNVFIVTRIMDWFGEIPEQLKQTLGWKTPLDLKFQDGLLKGPKHDLEEAMKKFRPFIHSQEKDGLRINRRYTFQLLASLIDEGVLPFTPQPVSSEDLVNRAFQVQTESGQIIKGLSALRPYQVEAWKKLQMYSHVGVYYPASTGKTIIALYGMTQLKPPHLVVVPSRLLIDQWTTRIGEHTDLKIGEEVTVTTYQSAIKHHIDKKYSMVIVDEAHHQPANDFSKLALIQRRYTLALSATPYREDGRESYVIAFSGYPVGLSWDYFRELKLIKSPVCNVWLLKDMAGKLRKIGEMLEEDKKTIIFCDHIELGKTVAARFKLPFVHGETKENRFKVFEENRVIVASRVADEGISLPEIQRVIEIDWLFKSRRQELQRFTRLLHGFASHSDGEHHILMTLGEYERDKARLFSVMDKGFKVEIQREGITERQFAKTQERAQQPQPTRREFRSASSPVFVPSAAESSMLAGLPPGLQRLILKQREPHQRLILHLYSRDGEWQGIKNLHLALDYISHNAMTGSISFADLEKRHLIERKHGHIRTNFRGLKE